MVFTLFDSIYLYDISIFEVLMILSTCFMVWLFEIGAGVYDMMTGCYLPGFYFWVVWFVLAMGAIHRSSRMREVVALYSYQRYFIVVSLWFFFV